MTRRILGSLAVLLAITSGCGGKVEPDPSASASATGGAPASPGGDSVGSGLPGWVGEGSGSTGSGVPGSSTGGGTGPDGDWTGPDAGACFTEDLSSLCGGTDFGKAKMVAQDICDSAGAVLTAFDVDSKGCRVTCCDPSAPSSGGPGDPPPPGVPAGLRLQAARPLPMVIRAVLTMVVTVVMVVTAVDREVPDLARARGLRSVTARSVFRSRTFKRKRLRPANR